MRKYNWKSTLFTVTSEVLDFVNKHQLRSEDFKIFAFNNYIHLVYNEGAIEEMKCS
jgi:hypothetical protein